VFRAAARHSRFVRLLRFAIPAGNSTGLSETMLPLAGLLNANRLEVMENGALSLFGGGVEMTLTPDQVRPAPQDSAPLGAPRTGFGSAGLVVAMTVMSVPGLGALVALAVATTMGIAVVHAQQSSGPPNALQGFSQNRDKPIKINSATLEVRDKDKMATFAGDVHLVQGDTSMRSQTLVVFYDDDAPSKPANTVTLSGNVVISQGPNVVKGDTLTVDMTTGVSRIACGKSQEKCRVQGLFQPGSMKPEGRGQEAAPVPTRARRHGCALRNPRGSTDAPSARLKATDRGAITFPNLRHRRHRGTCGRSVRSRQTPRFAAD
jgi:lipopolysaccharide export system protein LptA